MPSGYHHTPVTANQACYVGQGGDAPGNVVFPRYSDNDDDDNDSDRLAHLEGCQPINNDIYAEYGNGVSPRP
jgi:hypothetical protein